MAKYGQLLLLSLALSLPLSSAGAQGYWITEAELAALETALTTAQNELASSRQESETLREQLAALQTISTEQATQLTELSASYKKYAIVAPLLAAATITLSLVLLLQ